MLREGELLSFLNGFQKQTGGLKSPPVFFILIMRLSILFGWGGGEKDT